MDFNSVLQNRINTYNWTDQIPDQLLIDNIIQGIHDFVPSKQRVVRYDIRIIPTHKMPKLRQKLYKGTEAHPGYAGSRYNPQVLAPYVIAFAPRVTLAMTHSKDYLQYEAGVEIGLAAMFVSLAAPVVGLSVGFCACIQNEEDMIDDIGISPTLYLGIGYKSDDVQYHCPVYNKLVDIPNSNYDTKPNIEKYVKYV